MAKIVWFGVLIRAAGAAAVAGLIWFAGPFARYGDGRPLEDPKPRLAAILIVLLAVAAGGAYRLYQRRKRAARLALALGVKAGAPKSLVEKTLLDLPWYVLIGAPGAGKTAVLANSGFRPLLAPDPVAGVGAGRARACWASDDVVVIDAAARPASKDLTDALERQSWRAFFDQIKRNRPREPINGVLVAISVADLLTLPPAAATAQAAAIRAGLMELRKSLGVDFPAYALFTKADLVLGFREFFASLDDAGRAQVWGATFETPGKAKSALAKLGPELAALVACLNQLAPGRLAEEKDPAKRALLFGFPAQLEALSLRAKAALDEIFDPARYKINTPLRGFYFTSAVQQGAPIDQLLGIFAKDIGAEAYATSVEPSRAKSFFLEGLFKKVLIGEAGLVSAARGWSASRAAFASLIIVAPLILGALWMGYAKTNERIARSVAAAANYRALAAGLGATDSVSDHDLARVLPALHALRFLPGGFAAERTAAEDRAAGLGLSQSARLRSAAEAAYGAGLERLLRPRLIYRLEEQLAADAANPTALFETLEAYLMLGGLAPVDRQALIAWLERDWSKNLYPGGKNADGRKELEQHVSAMLDLAPPRGPMIALNGPLVEKAQAALAKVSVAERAFQILAARAKAGPGEDWVAGAAAGPESLVVFDKSIETVRTPYFLTKPGFQRAFLDQLPAIGADMARLRRILGAAGDQPEVSAQYDRLQQDLVDAYVKAFAAAWRSALDKLKIRRLVADRPSYPLLAAAASPNSPIARILDSIRDETTLADPEAAGAAAVVGTAGETPAAMIDAALRPYHQLADGEPKQRPIDKLLARLSDLRADLSRLAAESAPSDEGAGKFAESVAGLEADASNLPPPFAQMMSETAEAAKAEAGDLAAGRILEALRGAIAPVCRDRIASRYPFARDAKREVALEDFTHMFGPKGLLDQFASAHILPAVDASGPEWKWRDEGALAKRLGPSGLADFQRAAEIRAAFFAAAEPPAPGFAFSVTPPTIAGARLDINGTIIAAKTRKAAAASAQWPGPADNRRAALTFARGNHAPAAIERTGVWSIYRLIDAGRAGSNGAVTFSLGGRDLDYRFESRGASPGASLKPLDLTELRKFRCPHGG